MSSSQKTTLKKRKKNTILIPKSLADIESLELVPSPVGPIRTLAVSAVDKSIIIERFVNEIVQKFHFSLSQPMKRQRFTNTKCPQDAKNSHRQDIELKMAEFSKSRIIVGTNSCTRLLEKLYSSKSEGKNNESIQESSIIDPSSSHIYWTVSLCILSRDVRPATILSHIPYLCHLFNIPVLLLPGKASLELGAALGTKKVSIVLFQTKSQSAMEDPEKKWQQQIDSYVDFVKKKIP
mmetsp:Transcript_7894/g.14872  ORF Transcript_7894/g.14872 Transcript_7894/m.14872 type:complete len:236 (-) Transcript_7894:39-746(-)|eukprot:CAMPEP_0176491256 /NCGR_PEP_ID=MMETSP0200_2-20121128/8330_1 /TAXON_ID=947934 /ORGANISM="Chaetoceros sp., Strain GSL56" /LENGTH=235 /DNA_ID=CAMNT_0017888663 /DNA_START=56 /DNA_END=763 /DNA_ORIENTATION=-